jgi:hypothetical protein
VLRTGGRFAVSDVIADPETDDATRADMAAWTGCVAGALTETEFRAALQTAGFEAIEIRQTHRVHEHAAAAIIRARKPAAAGCCDTDALASCCEPEARPNAAGRRPTDRRRAVAARDDGNGPPARSAGALATGNTSNGNPWSIDLTADHDQWREALGDEDKRLVHWALSSLIVGEERITTKFAGLGMAAESEEEASFLASQQVDEARHMQLYARFQDEVIAEPQRSPRMWHGRASSLGTRSPSSSTRRS